MIDHVLALECLICGERYAPADVSYVCPKHGREGILDVVYDYEAIGSRFDRDGLGSSWDQGMWRYRPLLPVESEAAVPPLLVGDTPIYDAPRLAAEVQVRKVWVKDEGRQPTASLKDRASAMAVVKAAEQDADVITTASTGNAAAALSGLCASVARPNVIFVPAAAPPAKVAQLLSFGSTVLLVEGTYGEAFDLCLEAADRFGWYNRNTGFNPYMSEGKKTASYEIAEQLHWDVPDAVFVSVGDGCIIGGLHKGFRDLGELGWIDRIPRLIGVQAAGSNYLAEAWEQREDVLTKPPIDAHTVADSISAELPRDRIKAMRAVVDTGGAFVTVGDDEILAAIPAMGRGCGVFGEPAGAAAYAGLVRAAAEGVVGHGDRVVVLNTGSGLKDVASARHGAEQAGVEALTIPPSLEAVEAIADSFTEGTA
jgi:threonine synthase